MARLVPGRKACSDASTHRQSRVRRTPAAENRSGSTDWRNCPPPTHTAPGPSHLSWSPLLTVASFHFARMTSSKMWTPPGMCGLGTRQPGALSEGLEVTCAPEVGADGDLGVRCLLPPPRRVLQSHPSPSALQLPRPGPSVCSTKGATFPEAPSGPSRCSLEQKTRGRAAGGLCIVSQPSSDCPVSAAHGHCLWGALSPSQMWPIRVFIMTVFWQLEVKCLEERGPFPD